MAATFSRLVANSRTIPAGGVAAGMYLIMHITHVGGTVTITGDSRGNTWTLLGSSGVLGGRVYGAYINTALQAGDTVNQSTSGSPSAITYGLMEISGVDPVTPVDNSRFGSGTRTSSNMTIPSTTVNSDDCCAIAFWSIDGGASSTVTSPYTKDYDVSSSGFHNIAGHRNLGAAASQSPNATTTSGTTFGYGLIILKAAPGGYPKAIYM